MILNSDNIQRRPFMIDNEYQDFSQSRYGRKLLQTNSSFDASQPSFIALLCIISVLTTILVITVIVLCYRYYSYRERKFKARQKFQPISSIQTNQQSTVPIPATPTSDSLYSVRSSDQLVSNRHQTSSINTIPSPHNQQTMIDTYLNDINRFEPVTIDAQQLKSYLFIDLHSTSSETFPDNGSRTTSGYNTSTENHSHKKFRYNYKLQRRSRTSLYIKKPYTSRFLMRERTLSKNLQRLPQLRQILTQQQKHLFGINDSDTSSTTIINDDLQSTNISTTTDDYDDSHAYHVNQQQIIQTLKEEKALIVPHSSQFQYTHEPYLFEVVSTSRGDDSDFQMSYKSIPVGVAYINDSIIV